MALSIKKSILTILNEGKFMNLIKTSYGWLDITTGVEYVTENEYYENMEENKND